MLQAVLHPLKDEIAAFMNKQAESEKCPFCHNSNNCLVQTNSHCWCFALEVPPEMLMLLPKQQQGKSCICVSCIQGFISDRKTFLEFHKTFINDN